MTPSRTALTNAQARAALPIWAYALTGFAGALSALALLRPMLSLMAGG